VQALLSFYNQDTALFSNAGWWNNANTFEALIDYATLSGSVQDIGSMLSVAYDKNAQAHFFNNYYDDQVRPPRRTAGRQVAADD